ncbi:hypothetical protein Patl1_36128 [Pistacia atlantica]|nr:hypothetical protein Patl1_36128 [Pistacia atlantica]
MEDGCRSELTRSNSESSDITVESSYQYPNETVGSKDIDHKKKHGDHIHPKHYQPTLVFHLHQLMVLQDGCWQKNKLTEEESLFESTADSHGTLESPGIRRFTTVGKFQTATSFDPRDHSVLCDEGFYLREDMTFSAESAGCSGQHQDYHLCHQNSVGSTTEDKPRNMARRSQTTAFDDPKSDQVLPRSGTQYFLRGS